MELSVFEPNILASSLCKLLYLFHHATLLHFLGSMLLDLKRGSPSTSDRRVRLADRDWAFSAGQPTSEQCAATEALGVGKADDFDEGSGSTSVTRVRVSAFSNGTQRFDR